MPDKNFGRGRQREARKKRQDLSIRDRRERERI